MSNVKYTRSSAYLCLRFNGCGLLAAPVAAVIYEVPTPAFPKGFALGLLS